MSKPRRRTRARPPLPPIGSYVLLFQAPDGTLHDPPVPLDQRLTDDELKEVVHAVHAKLKARGATINQADELPGGIKLEQASAEEQSLRFADPVSSADEIAQRLGLPGIDPGERFKARDEESLREYHEEFFNADGSAKHPVGGRQSPAPQNPVPAEESWSKALLAVGLQGFCIMAGSLLAGACVIVGGWAAIKFLSST
jgi:hypothetical protein